MRASLERYVGGKRQLKLLKQLKLEAVRPIVQYKELVGALQGVAEALSARTRSPCLRRCPTP